MLGGLIRVLVLSLLPLAAAGGVLEDVWQQAPRQTDRLGLAFPTDDAQAYPALSAMGMGVVRVPASWGRMEADGHDFSGLDYRIRALGAQGIAPFITLDSNHRRLARFTGQVRNGEPKDLKRWQAFVQAVVERYDGDGEADMPGLIRPALYVQTANEFLGPKNRSGGWAGTDAALVDFLRATYDAVKRADADMPVVLGGIAAFNMDIALLADGLADFEIRQEWSETARTVVTRAELDAPRWRAMVARLNTVLDAAPFDIADAHLYGPETRDALRLAWLAERTGKPVLSSECGGPTTDYGTAYSGHRHFAAVLERNLGVLAAGGQVCLWFGLNDRLKTSYSNRNTPLHHADMSEKPGVAGYRLLGALLSDGGPVVRLGPRQFAIDTRDGTICAAFGQPAKALPTDTCHTSPFAVCILDAATRTAQLAPVATLSDTCPDEAIALTGSGLSPLLKRNRQP